MLEHAPFLTAQLAAERQARFAADAASWRVRRLLRRPHPAPPCGGLAAQLPEVAIDLRSTVAADEAPTPAR
jgi:hypothetical protein